MWRAMSASGVPLPESPEHLAMAQTPVPEADPSSDPTPAAPAHPVPWAHPGPQAAPPTLEEGNQLFFVKGLLK